MKRFVLINLFILLAVVVPVFALAQEATTGLVPCTGEDCNVDHIFILIGNIIKFLIFTVALPLCALVITYGGIQIAMYSTNPGAKEKGKAAIIAAIIGLMIALGSYLIVDTILKTFTDRSIGEAQINES